MMKKLRKAVRKFNPQEVPSEQEELMEAAPMPEEAEESQEEVMSMPVENDEPTSVVDEEPVRAEEVNEDLTLTLDTIGETPVIWDLTTGEHLLFVTNADSDPSEIYQNLETEIQKRDDRVEYFGIDLSLRNPIFPNQTDSQSQHLALNLHETWDLSEALVTERAERKEGKEGKEGKKIVVIINQSEHLHSILNDEENLNDPRFSKIKSNLDVAVKEGTSVGIHFLIQIDSRSYSAEVGGDYKIVLVLG